MQNLKVKTRIQNLKTKAVAHAVGVGAVKFYDLKTDRHNGYDFDLEAMVHPLKEKQALISNTLMLVSNLSFVRQISPPDANADYRLNDAESWEIIKLLQDFGRVVKTCCR